MLQFSAQLPKSNRKTQTPSDELSDQLSVAKQAHERAYAMLQDALCKTLDGPNCECSLKVVAQ